MQAIRQPRFTLARNVRFPLGMTVDIGLYLRLHFIEWQKPVFRRLLDRHSTGERGMRGDQFIRTQIGSAFLTLIAVSFRVSAMRAGTHNKTIDEKHFRLLVIILFRYFFAEMSLMI